MKRITPSQINTPSLGLLFDLLQCSPKVAEQMVGEHLEHLKAIKSLWLSLGSPQTQFWHSIMIDLKVLKAKPEEPVLCPTERVITTSTEPMPLPVHYFDRV